MIIEKKARNLQKIFSFAIIMLFALAGCKPSVETTKPVVVEPSPVKEPTPAITLNVATLDLSKHGTRYEMQAIANLADVVSREDIQVLSLQRVTRYPEIESRPDIIEELRKRTNMYQKFGETQNFSGRLTGNAIFSIYPFRATENFEFKKIKILSTSLNAGIDVGVENLLVSSFTIPEKLSSSEQKYTVSELNQIHNNFNSAPFIITGNVNSINTKVLDEAGYIIEQYLAHRRSQTLILVGTRTVKTDFDKILIYKFGLFNTTAPTE